MSSNRDQQLDPRVEAYLTGRLTPDEEALFCDELIASPELQRQVAEAELLRGGLAAGSASRKPAAITRWLAPAAAAVLGLVTGALFFGDATTPTPTITGAPHTVGGQLRGAGDLIVLPAAREGVTVLFPAGRCRVLQAVEVVGPGGESLIQARGLGEQAGFSLTIPRPQAGYHEARITYGDCPAETRSFFIAPGEDLRSAKAALFSGSWTVLPGATTDLVQAGGTITIEIGPDGPEQEVSFVATGMGERDDYWNEVSDAVLVDDAITGTLERDGIDYAFKITREADEIHCRIEARAAELPKDDEGGGDWNGGGSGQ